MTETTDYGRYAPEYEPSAEDHLYYIIMRLIEQSCGQNEGREFDSWAISAYEHAIEELHQAGFVEIEPTCGRIYAKLTPKGSNFQEWMESREHP
jgi:hypothetical protein